jgi:asparaginyl-tRNA synthetase
MRDMNKASVKKARSSDSIGRQVLVQGWVRTRRDSKAGFSFIEVNDGSCMANLQIIADVNLPNYESEIKRLAAGCSVSVEGEIKPSEGRGQVTELHAGRITVLGWADPESYPLQKKRHSFEKLREWAHLRPRTNTFGAIARVRNCVSNSIHAFFQREEFLYVHTPIITASDCEGAGALFRVTTLDLHSIPRQSPGPSQPDLGDVDYSLDFFQRPAFLTVSGQLEGEIFATALGKVYTFGPTFRAENSNTTRHLAEFWMIEPEMAFCDLQDNMDLAEDFVRFLLRDVLENCPEDMAFFDQRIEPGITASLRQVAESTFHRLTYSDAIEALERSGHAFEFPPSWGIDLQTEHEKFLTEEYLRGPVIVTDYPREIKAFYMKQNNDGRTVRAMDVLVPRLGEIIGGSQREERLEVLERRMAEQDLNPADYWWYLDLRRYGTVPHAGFGLGLERLIQFITGMANIRDVIPFPRTPGSAEF